MRRSFTTNTGNNSGGFLTARDEDLNIRFSNAAGDVASRAGLPVGYFDAYADDRAAGKSPAEALRNASDETYAAAQAAPVSAHVAKVVEALYQRFYGRRPAARR